MPRNDERTVQRQQHGTTTTTHPNRAAITSSNDVDDEMRNTKKNGSSSSNCSDMNDPQLTPRTQNSKKRQRQQPRRRPGQTQSEAPPGRATSQKRTKTDRSKEVTNESISFNTTATKNEPKVFFGEYWEIEKVLGVRERIAYMRSKKRRQVGHKGKKVLEFLIQWKGSQYDNSWEPEENLCDTALVEAKKLMEEHRKTKRREQLGLRTILLPPDRLEPRLDSKPAATMDNTKIISTSVARAGGKTSSSSDDNNEEEEEEEDNSSLGGISILTASILGENDDDNDILETIQRVDNMKPGALKHDATASTIEGVDTTHHVDVMEDTNFDWTTDHILPTMEIERISVLDPNCAEKVMVSRSMGIPIVLTDHNGYPQFASRWLSCNAVPAVAEEDEVLNHEPMTILPNQQDQQQQHESIISYDSIATLTTTTVDTTTATSDTKAKEDDVPSDSSSAYCKVLDDTKSPPQAKRNSIYNDDTKSKSSTNQIIDLTTSNVANDDVITISSSRSLGDENSVEVVLSNRSVQPTSLAGVIDMVDVQVQDPPTNEANADDKKIAARHIFHSTQTQGESTADTGSVVPLFADDGINDVKMEGSSTTPDREAYAYKINDNALITAAGAGNDEMLQDHAKWSVNDNSIPPFNNDDILVHENDNVTPMLDLTLQYTVDVDKMVQDIGNEMVPILRKKYDDENPIKSHMTVRRFLRDCWPGNNALRNRTNATSSCTTGSRKMPSLYLHQWLFTASPTAVPKLCNQVNLIPHDILGEDLLRYWYNKERCDGDSPYQYIFMGDTDTLSRLHKDNGGLDIFLAPIVGQKEVKLVHRADGVTSLYNLDACIDRPDLNKFPMLYSARIWKSVIHPGEILIMPQGTYHQCRNITPCLSYHRFHLDTLNLKAFYESWNDKDAPDIDHEEVIWNAATELCIKVDSFVDSVRRNQDPKPEEDHFVPTEVLSAVTSLRALRNVCKEIAVRLNKCKDWELIVHDVEESLHDFRYRLCEDIPAM